MTDSQAPVDVHPAGGHMAGVHTAEAHTDGAGAPAGVADGMTTLLSEGDLDVSGRLVDSSNAALVGTVARSGVRVDCVYKPVRGERPLWDFPDGTLAGREVAAFEVARAAGWDCVPPTVLRDGPFGPGMVQQWIGDADPGAMVEVLPPEEVPPGWLPILTAEGPRGEPLVVAHADAPALAVLAGFDLVVNNADRKGAHILPVDGRVLGVDHGVTFHAEPKLRTILWGWAGRELPEAVVAGVRRLAVSVSARLGERLADLLADAEVEALAGRIDALAADPRFPLPPDDRTPIPWPPL